MTTTRQSTEIAHDERFEFGKNWQRFLSTLDEQRIEKAKAALIEMLAMDNLKGQSFLDVGCGSGLSSLVARRLGARVHSFDYDPEAVACALALKQRYAPSDPNWTIEQGSVLDREYLQSLGQFDIVYSWGVLHHTGQMWQALANVTLPLAPNGLLYIAIYNDRPVLSRLWLVVKKTYNQLPSFLKVPFVILVMIPNESITWLTSLLMLRPGRYFRSWTESKNRGMSKWHDWVDWVGGYPYETALPEKIFDYYYKQGFVLTRLKTGGGGLGNNEYIFKKAEGHV